MYEQMTPAAMSAKGLALVVRACDQIIRWSVVVLAALLPVFVLPWTIEVAEINKQLLLVVVAGLAGLAWLAKMLIERQLQYRRSVVNVMVVLFVAVYAISSWLSYSPYLSIVGDFGQEKAGLVTVISLAVLYFVIAGNVRTYADLRRIFGGIMVGGLLAAAYALLQGMGAFILPFDFTRSASFNTVGTMTSLGVYLAFVVALAGGLLLAGHGRQPGTATAWDKAWSALIAVTGGLSLLVVAVIDYWPVTLCLLASALVLLVFAFVHAKLFRGLLGIALPIAAVVIALFVLVFDVNVPIKYPAEVMPSMEASWDITVKTLREKPFFGSGPGTFIFDYAKHRSVDVNQTDFWNIRFDRGSIRLHTLLATTGLLGALSWLVLVLFVFFSSGRKLLRADENEWHVLIGTFSAWLAIALSRFVYSSNITLEMAFWLATALLVVSYRPETVNVKFDSSPRAAMAVSFLFVLGIVFGLAGAFVEGNRYAGEVAYAKAIRADRAGDSADEVMGELKRAVSLNGNNDVYARNLALAALSKANRALSAEVKLDREEGESDADYDKRLNDAKSASAQEAFDLIAEAVKIAKASTVISEHNVSNWSVLGSVYSSLLGVTAGADGWAIASYEKAIELEPANPVFRTELGKVYLYQGDLAGQVDAKASEEQKAAAEGKAKEIYGKAVEQLTKAVELKADYAPARYNLSLALDRQGKLKEAIGRMEEVVSLDPRDVGVGFQLSLMYYRDDRKDEARRLMASVVSLSPDFSNARWYLAAMLEEAGDLDGAIEQVKKVEELNPGNELVERKLEELNQKKAAPVATEIGPDGQPLPPPVDQPTQNQNQPEVKR